MLFKMFRYVYNNLKVNIYFLCPNIPACEQIRHANLTPKKTLQDKNKVILGDRHVRDIIDGREVGGKINRHVEETTDDKYSRR